jgi:hypothetical protein
MVNGLTKDIQFNGWAIVWGEKVWPFLAWGNNI